MSEHRKAGSADGGAAAEHAREVRAFLSREIAAAGGWISFERYMELALYAPGLGYYSAGSTKFGAAGDFVTAPEISPLFALCLARAIAGGLMPGPEAGTLLELGAGTGALAAVLLPELEALSMLPEAYLILEVSAELAARQRQRLAQLPPHLAARVRWLERLPEVPFRGVVLANEVFDALPCRRFRLRDRALRELGVASERGELMERDADPDPALVAAVERRIGAHLADLPEGYTSELCLAAAPLMSSLAACLAAGAVLCIDYGLPGAQYYHPQRIDGTLRTHHRHCAGDDPLALPGMQDITAWVDFTALAEAGLDAGLELAGFCTQAAFLLANGIEARVAAAPDERARLRLAGEARRLLLPGEMGEAVKVLALSRGVPQPVPGFALQDLRHSL